MNIYCFSTLSFAKLQFKSVINKAFHKHGVASFTDAWIETQKDYRRFWKEFVASFTDAWIETIICKVLLLIRLVASFTDAWIETAYLPIVCGHLASHLLQMRGLKLSHHKFRSEIYMSHLLQMRGLKQRSSYPVSPVNLSHLLQMRGLKLGTSRRISRRCSRIFYRCVD